MAFVKLCLQIAAPNGFVCLVLPKDFLTAANAKFLRSEISANFNVRCLVDLSAVAVFDKVGTYNVLLIIQKRAANLPSHPPAQIARIKGFVGPALQACLDGRAVETPYYDVFELGQSFFEKREWVLLGPEEIGLSERLEKFKPISSYLSVMQGFVSGADKVFIIDRQSVPDGEAGIYVDYLPDREITKFSLPKRSEHVVFYPYENGEPISEDRLQAAYPQTWSYLKKNKADLESRRSVTSGDTPWWRPVRPRQPKYLMRPKIVCPHLMLTPRFAVDQKGGYAVSHSPFLVTKEGEEEATILKFFAAILNSSVCQWFLSIHAQKYSRGYNLLEVSTIKKIPVPDPATATPSTLNELIDLVDLSMRKGDTPSIDKKIDEIVCELYGLTERQREIVMGLSDE